jgi:prolyl-tRNA editing enzyme YbaK/EbsC (Cys-tRNA(Pro) deacylase)
MGAGADQVLEAINALEMPYELIPIDPAYADTTMFCEHYHYPLAHSCNTIIVASKKVPKQFAACVVLATTRLDVNRRVRQLLGVSRLSFATSGEMMALTGMQVGGVTPFALPEGVPLYVDQRIMMLDWIILGGGGRDTKVKIAPEVFHRLNADIIADLARE